MTRRSSTLVICALLLLSIVAAQDQCAPATWTKGSITRRHTFANSTFPNGTQPENSTSIKPGQINCRYFAKTRDTVDDYTCFNVATRYQITVATFFGLNPSLNQSCGNIRPNTQYCVAGCESSRSCRLFDTDIKQLLSLSELRTVCVGP